MRKFRIGDLSIVGKEDLNIGISSDFSDLVELVSGSRSSYSSRKVIISDNPSSELDVYVTAEKITQNTFSCIIVSIDTKRIRGRINPNPNKHAYVDTLNQKMMIKSNYLPILTPPIGKKDERSGAILLACFLSSRVNFFCKHKSIDRDRARRLVYAMWLNNEFLGNLKVLAIRNTEDATVLDIFDEISLNSMYIDY